MKRIILLILVLVTVACLFVGCKRTECDICGEKAFCTKYEVWGEECWICGDCEDELEAWGLIK